MLGLFRTPFGHEQGNSGFAKLVMRQGREKREPLAASAKYWTEFCGITNCCFKKHFSILKVTAIVHVFGVVPGVGKQVFLILRQINYEIGRKSRIFAGVY